MDLSSPAASWVPAPMLAVELGISRRTLSRWVDDPRVNFPSSRRVRGQLYFIRGEVDAWKASADRGYTGPSEAA